MEPTNIILTGIPRSGSTLICYLLNKVNNTIALNEPIKVNYFNDTTPKQQICKQIDDYFSNTRLSALNDKRVFTHHMDGKVPDNSFLNEKNNNGLRTNLGMQKSFVEIENKISEDFTLCIKHNGIFTFLLDELSAHYPCYATIRNPLSILASWNSLDLPLNNGHIPIAENLDKELRNKLKAIPNKIERQLHILSWFFSHYHKHLPKERIIRYEDVIASRGSSLSLVTPEAGNLSEPLINKNANELYDNALMHSLGKQLLNTEGDYWQFYTHEDVKELLSEITY